MMLKACGSGTTMQLGMMGMDYSDFQSNLLLDYINMMNNESFIFDARITS